MIRYTIHLDLRDDLLPEEAWDLANTLADELRRATGDVFVTTTDDWSIHIEEEL